MELETLLRRVIAKVGYGKVHVEFERDPKFLGYRDRLLIVGEEGHDLLFKHTRYLDKLPMPWNISRYRYTLLDVINERDHGTGRIMTIVRARIG